MASRRRLLAAKRAGIKEIILSDENRKNIEEIQEIYLKGLTFHYVKDVKEVFAIALTDEKVADAIDLSVKERKDRKERRMTFELQYTDSKTNARAGLITTDHGQIETPIFMPVGTVGNSERRASDRAERGYKGADNIG